MNFIYPFSHVWLVKLIAQQVLLVKLASKAASIKKHSISDTLDVAAQLFLLLNIFGQNLMLKNYSLLFTGYLRQC